MGIMLVSFHALDVPVGIFFLSSKFLSAKS